MELNKQQEKMIKSATVGCVVTCAVAAPVFATVTVGTYAGLTAYDGAVYIKNKAPQALTNTKQKLITIKERLGSKLFKSNKKENTSEEEIELCHA